MFQKKYTCCLCSDDKEKGKNIVFFCRDCKRIREYIRQNGLKAILNAIVLPSAPEYK